MRIFGFILAASRLLAFVLVTSLFITWYLVRSIFMGRDLSYILGLRKVWMRWMFPVLGLRPHVSGKIPDRPALLCCNHVSYIDPALVLYSIKALAIAKIQVSSWPFIGYVADLSGTLFVDRDDPDSTRKIRDTMVEYLRKGYSIINFPEGTTTSEPQTIEFKPGGFKAAADNKISIVPVSLWFDNPYAPFIEEMTFLPHFFRCFSKRITNGYIHYGHPIASSDTTRLMTETKQSIDRELQFIVDEKMA